MKWKTALSIAGACMVLAGALGPLVAHEPRRPRTSPNIVFETDIDYTSTGEADLLLDIARPARGEGPFPAVVCIHGGAWRAGNKNRYRPFIRQLAEHGYVAITVQYRLSPKYLFPSHVEDVKCAVRYLRSQAKRLKIDPDRIGAMGESAGGHLSLMLGLTDEKSGLEGEGGYPNFSSKVQAVVNYYGPTDLTLRYEPNVRDLITGFIGAPLEVKREQHLRASPITYLTPDDPPILTFHGTADNVVPYEQATVLDAACKKAGVPHRLVTLEGEGHGFKGGVLLQTLEQTVAFFDEHLKHTK